MRLYLATIGSRGDNEPFRALAAEAAAAGHEVFFAHTTDLPTDPTARYTELPLGGSFGAIIAQYGISVIRVLLAYKTTVAPLLDGAAREVVTQIQELAPDVVVYHPKLVGAPIAAHAIGAIAVIVEMFPSLTPTVEFPPLGMPHGMPGAMNTVGFRMLRALTRLGTRALGDPARNLAKKLGVVGVEPDMTLCAVSQAILTQPADWPPHAVITGAWAQPSEGELDAELAEFLAEGPIVYAGFGSMKDSHGRRRASTIVRAAQQLGFKTLLVTGWGGLDPSLDVRALDDVMIRESLPHSLVLPQVSVAIHHGGAGTTHAMLRAGVPSVIMPFIADQPWWAARLRHRGLGPAAVSRTTTNHRALARSLAAALGCGDAVRAAASFMATEDGLGRALSLLEDAEAGMIPLGPA